MTAIAVREARIRAITDKLIEPGPDSLQEKLGELRSVAVSNLTRLRELLASPSEIHEARAFLAERVGKFTLQRVQSNGKFSFKAEGKMDFFGDLHAWMVPGARIAPRVHYMFSLPLAEAEMGIGVERSIGSPETVPKLGKRFFEPQPTTEQASPGPPHLR
jgi:hypothetical protein